MSDKFGWTPKQIDEQPPEVIEGYFLIMQVLGKKQEQEAAKAKRQQAAHKGKPRRK